MKPKLKSWILLDWNETENLCTTKVRMSHFILRFSELNDMSIVRVCEKWKKAVGCPQQRMKLAVWIIQFVDGSRELIVWTRHRANHVHVHINIHLMNINQTRCHFLNNSVPISRHIYLITESKSIYKCWKHYSTHSFHRQRHKSKRLQWWSHRMISTLSWDLSKRRKCFHRQMHRCQRYHRPPYPWAM